MTKLSVLILERDRHRCESLALLLGFMEYDYQQVCSFDEANRLENKQFDLVFVYESDDLVVSIKKLNEFFSISKVVVLASVDNSLSPQRFNQYPNFLAILEYPVKKQPLQAVVASLNKGEADAVYKNEGLTASINNDMTSLLDNLFVGESIVIQQVKKLITQVAKSNASVLILGESGTGKEVVANCLHQLSQLYALCSG